MKRFVTPEAWSVAIVPSMQRRDFHRLMTAALGTAALPAMAQSQHTARLVIVGGAEDRLQDRVILRKFVERIRVSCG